MPLLLRVSSSAALTLLLRRCGAIYRRRFEQHPKAVSHHGKRTRKDSGKINTLSTVFEQMLKCWRLYVAKQATTFATSAMKFKNTKPRPVAPLGSRILTSTDDIFKHNMWDHVEWTDEDKEDARKKAQENSHEQIPAAEKGMIKFRLCKFDADACQYWDKFYEIHQNKFFKDRRNTDSFLYCCDFSSRAIQIVKEHQDYDDSICHAFVHDICEEGSSFPFPLQSLDVILAVFVLSSIHPERLQGVVNRLSSYLKPGGMFLFRDYGRYDFSQLRFKKAAACTSTVKRHTSRMVSPVSASG
ncbi:Methyltransferase-like protein [Oryzias melastigma]|uniref:Methyltransferase-like protein n=1 Tax=Oryzias melastigma TaxID=30732 RepID=A0A834CDK4_ORYME|nr:Methyltransferase-like protein [Oryzias melastigma]